VWESVTSQVSQVSQSHEEYGKIVHRPYSSCISSVQEIKKNLIEFFLLTWTWRVIKSSRLSCYNREKNFLDLNIDDDKPICPTYSKGDMLTLDHEGL